MHALHRAGCCSLVLCRAVLRGSRRPLLTAVGCSCCHCCGRCCCAGAEGGGAQAGRAHQQAKEMLQLTEWMAAVGQGDKDMLVSAMR